MKTERTFFYCSVVVGHDVLVKATSGPRHKQGWEPLCYMIYIITIYIIVIYIIIIKNVGGRLCPF